MFNLENICNPTMKEYYLMTILDLDDGLEIELVEKAVEDLWEEERYAEAIGLHWAIEEFKTKEYLNNLVNGKEKE